MDRGAWWAAVHVIIVQLPIRVHLFCHTVDCSPPGSFVQEISQALSWEYWSGLPFPSPGRFLNSGIEPKSKPALQADSLPLSHQGRP